MLRTRWLLLRVGLAALVAGCVLQPAGHPVPSARPPVAPVVASPSLPPPRPAVPPIDVASWYGDWHHGRPTASGEAFDKDGLTAAHRLLPLGSCVEVTRLANGRRVIVRVNDRGPYWPGRTIDLSYRAARELGMVDDGLASVRIRRLPREACVGAGVITEG